MKSIDMLLSKFLWVTYHMVNGTSRIGKTMQQRVSNNFSAANVRWTWSLKPCMHFKWKSMKKHNSVTFRCTGVSSAYVIRIVITDRTQHIWQSHLVLEESRLYSVFISKYETARLFVATLKLLLAYDLSSGAPDCPGHIWLWPIHPCIFAYHIWHQDSQGDMESLYKN